MQVRVRVATSPVAATAFRLVLLSRTAVVWAVLVVATVASWLLGADHSLAGSHWPSVVVLVIAMAKVRFVGIYFMELRDAPTPFRVAFEAYCGVVLLLLIGMYLLF